MSMRAFVPVSCLLLLVACGAGGGDPSASQGASAAAAVPASPSTVSSPTQSPVPVSGSNTGPDGSVQVTDAGVGYRLTLPDGYLRITKKSDRRQLAKALKMSTGEVEQLRAAASDPDMKLFAVKQRSGATIGLAVIDSGGITGDGLVTLSDRFKRNLMDQYKGARIRMSKTTVNGKPGLRADFVDRDADGSLPVTLVYGVYGWNLFLTSFSNVPEPVIATVVSSERFFSPSVASTGG